MEFLIIDKYFKYYDPKQESKHITYLNANNLYGCAMPEFLLKSGFKWVDPKELYLSKFIFNSSKGCVLKIDLEYFKELQNLHNYYPLAPD